MSGEGGDKKMADCTSLSSSQARTRDDPDKNSEPLAPKQSQSNVFPHPKQTISNVYSQLPSSPNTKTIYARPEVKKRMNLSKEMEGAVECSGSNAGRLDYCTDKAVMGGNLTEICKEKSNNDSHTLPSSKILASDSKGVDLSTGVEGIGKTRLCEPEEISDTEADNVCSSTTQEENAVIHTFTFPLESHKKGERLTSHRKDNTSCQEMESELHSVTNGQMSEVHLHPDSAVFKPKSRGKKPHGIKESGKDGRDSDSSVSSRKRGSSKRTKVKSKFAPGSLEYFEEHLVGRIFSGWVEERGWVESVAGYRDVVEVDEWEVEMNQQLKAIVSSIPGVQEGTRWINITPPSATNPSYCLWVLLAAPPRPGHYWFTINAVHNQPQFGLRIVLKEIRQINPHDGESMEARQRRRGEGSGDGQGGGVLELENASQLIQVWLDQLCSLNWASIWAAIVSTITITNIKETFRFVVVLLMTVVLGLVTVVRESHHAGLRFIREGGIFLRNITPFMQSVLGFVEKLVGGLYLLVAMVYRDLRRPGQPTRPPPSPYPPINTPTTGMRSTPYAPRQIKYAPPQSWVFKNENQDQPHS